jgi:predicted Fe-Mo cluster-binding NifX family protein
MKIAAISDDGKKISQHFGMATLYVVVTVENGQVTGKETRPKSGHHSFSEHHAHDVPGEKHGYDAGAQARHTSMIDPISDCQVVLAGGMGWGAQESLKNRGIDVITTDIENIDEAVKLYIQGKLVKKEERLH